MSDQMDTEVMKVLKENEYRAYIEEHCDNVLKAYKEMLRIYSYHSFVLDPDLRGEFHRRCTEHDASKYSEEEFKAYREHFHSISEEEKEASKESFDVAWKHHYTVNDHHWEHYVDNDGVAHEIPLIAIAELIADWMAMSMKFGGTPLTYYKSNKQEINLHPVTKDRLEAMLQVFI